MDAVVREKSHGEDEGVLYARILLVPSKHLGWLALRAMIQNKPSVRLVGEEGSADAAVRLAERTRPDAVLMDVEPRDYPIPVLVRRFQEQCPEAKLLVFGAEPNRRIQSILGELGVEAFLLWEDLTPEALHYARRRTHGRTLRGKPSSGPRADCRARTQVVPAKCGGRLC